MVSPQESRPNNRIFVGKLSLDVDQNALKEHFSQVGEVVNVKVKKNSRRNIAFAFINFANENSPQDALSKFHDSQYQGNQIDVQIAKEVKKTPKRNANNNNNNNAKNNNNGKNAGNNRRQNNNNNNNNNNNRRASNNNENKEKELSTTTLFVSNLPFVVDDEKLKQLFEGFNVKSAYTVTRNGRSRGYGFVEFETEDAAKSALESKNKLQVEDREISVRNAFKNDEPAVQKSNSSDTLYVSNLPYKLSDETLQEIFNEYNVSKAYVARTKKGRSKGFGFVVLAGDDSSARQEKAIAEKNKHKIEDREIFVRAAYNSAEGQENNDNGNDNNNDDEPDVKQIALYVSNIPFSVTSEELAGLFKDTKGFQNANVVVARKNGRSRGYGFVTFDTEEDRDNAAESKKELQAGDRTLSISVARGKKSNNNNNNNNNSNNNNRGRVQQSRRRRFNNNNSNNNSNNNNNNNGNNGNNNRRGGRRNNNRNNDNQQ